MDILIFIVFFVIGYMILHNLLVIIYFGIFSLALSTKQPSTSKNNINEVTVILPVYNEAKLILSKLENIKECINGVNNDIKIEVLIGSDGSTDATCKIVRAYIADKFLSNWRLLEFSNNGKCQTINKLLEIAEGEIIISTDTDVITENNAFEILINAFKEDKGIGCISCIPVFEAKDIKLQKLYWYQELRIRDFESKIGKLIVVTGWLYAFKREVFQPIPIGVMADDLWIPLNILLKGYKSVHHNKLLVLSEKTDEKTENLRRRRVISGGIDVVKRLLGQLIKEPILFFIVFSHKINRWLFPLWVLLLAFSLIIFKLYIFFSYFFVILILFVILKPKLFLSSINAFFSPMFSLAKVFVSKDLSRWEHTRK
jgi:poly-beta-1,6-N-acetyl-D-glucosamine synthase